MSSQRLIRLSLATALVGGLLLAVGFVVDPPRAWLGYLNAWDFGATLCVGALLLLTAGHASKASWMVVTRRLTESIVIAMPLYLLLFVPIALGLASIYPWAAHDIDPALRAAVEHKRAYLNPPFFIARTLFYFAVFILVSALLRSWSRSNDERPSAALVHRMRMLSGAAIPVLSLCLTWASFDWTMSLQPDWYSTIYGLYTFAGGFVGAIALVCILLHLSRHAKPDHAQALGRLLLAMTIFWAYMAFSQLLIYWIGDVPEEIRYYRLRTTGSWTAVTVILIFGHFFIPFFALLNRRWKRHERFLAFVGVYMMAMHFVDVYWLILPVHDVHGVRPQWADLGGLLFVGGLSCAWSARGYARVPRLPLHVPELAKGLDYEAAV